MLHWGLTKRCRADGPDDGPDDGPGDMREMPKWSLLVLDMYLTTDLQFTRQQRKQGVSANSLV